MRTRIPGLICLSVAAIMLYSCSGSGSSGTIITVSLTPTYNKKNTPSVDVVQDTCKSGDFEYFADHSATAVFSASLYNSNMSQPLTFTIDRYTITFTTMADSPLAPPIQTDSREQSASFTVSGSTTSTLTMDVSLVDLVRKVKYMQDLSGRSYGSSPDYLNNYTATYVFEGHNDRGESFTVSGSTNFEMGDFDNCT